MGYFFPNGGRKLGDQQIQKNYYAKYGIENDSTQLPIVFLRGLMLLQYEKIFFNDEFFVR